MNRNTAIFLIILASYSLHAAAQDYQFVAEDRSPVTRFCIAAANNDLTDLRIALKKMSPSPHQKHKTTINSVRCNGLVAAHFAQTYLATETFEYLYKFTEKRNKEVVPHTSVEEYVLSREETKDPGIVIVQVSGNN